MTAAILRSLFSAVQRTDPEIAPGPTARNRRHDQSEPKRTTIRSDNLSDGRCVVKPLLQKVGSDGARHRAIRWRTLAVRALFANGLGILTLGSAPAIAQVRYEPLVFHQVFGTRPFVVARIDGHPYELMVHANASSVIEITPAVASTLSLRLIKAGRYGIDRPGHISDAGLSTTVLGSLTTAGSRLTDVKAFVHALPSGDFNLPGKTQAGMLGIKWLRSTGAIVDASAGRIGFPQRPGDGIAEDRRLEASGYRRIAMVWDDQAESFRVKATFDGVPASMMVGTVGGSVVDLGGARIARLPVGPQVDIEGGPKGALVPAYSFARALSLTVGGVAAADILPETWDIGAYSSHDSLAPRAELDGSFGADFLLANGAVVDFGTGTLFLPRSGAALSSTPQRSAPTK